MINDPAHALSKALALAEQGFSVFPCRNDKSPFPGSRGFKDATPDPVEVAKLWRRYPGELIGVATGEISSVDVLDIDSAKHPEAVAWYLSNKHRIPLTRTHQTGSGGLHILFRHDPGSRTGNGRLGIGIDVKANGGYVIWWPATGRKIVDAAIADWPRWLIGKQQPAPAPVFRRTGATPANLEPVANFVASLCEGERNQGTFWGFCRAYDAIASGSVSESEAIQTITEAALRAGLSLSEVRKIARSARTRSVKHVH